MHIAQSNERFYNTHNIHGKRINFIIEVGVLLFTLCVFRFVIVIFSVIHNEKNS